MKTRRRHRIALAAGITGLVAIVLAGGTLAAQQAVIGLFNSRGTIEPFSIRSPDIRFKVKGKKPIDVAVVGAQLEPGSQTGWHIHPADSIVTVRPGGPAMRVIDVYRARCRERMFQAGQAFVHSAAPHNFMNTDAANPLTFGVVYFVPVGSTLLTNVPPPAACA
jgi:hypothetical protein